jgi:drug/metabolite transporter (DMT)-like permease
MKNMNNKIVGIQFMLVASFFFAIVASLVKHLKDLPLMEVIFFQSFPSMIFLPFIIMRKKLKIFGNNKNLLLTRCILTFGCIIACFYTLRTMNITDAMVLRQLGPIFVTLFGIIFLREKFYFCKVPIILLAFLGALLVINPRFRSDLLPVFIGIVGAILGGLSHISIRKLRLTDNPFIIMNYYIFFTGIISLLILFITKNFQIPNIRNIVILILLGLAVFFAQYFLTVSYRLAEASLISLYAYSQIIFCTIFGVIIFKEVINFFTILGVLCMVLSGYLNYRFSRIRSFPMIK